MALLLACHCVGVKLLSHTGRPGACDGWRDWVGMGVRVAVAGKKKKEEERQRAR